MDTLIQPKLPSSHPLAGSAMSGADIIVQVLADEGVDTIFGYSGGAILPTYDAVFRYNKSHSVNGVEPMPLLANGLRLASQDGFASARGEAFVATADNPSHAAELGNFDRNNVFRKTLVELRCAFFSRFGVVIQNDRRPAV